MVWTPLCDLYSGSVSVCSEDLGMFAQVYLLKNKNKECCMVSKWQKETEGAHGPSGLNPEPGSFQRLGGGSTPRHILEGAGMCSAQAGGKLLIYTREGPTQLLLLINRPAVTARPVHGINSGPSPARTLRSTRGGTGLTVITIHAGEDTLFPRQWQRR